MATNFGGVRVECHCRVPCWGSIAGAIARCHCLSAIGRCHCWVPCWGAIAGCHCSVGGVPLLGACWVPCRGAAGRHCWVPFAGVPLLGTIVGAMAGCHCWMLATDFGGVHVGCHCSVPMLGCRCHC